MPQPKRPGRAQQALHAIRDYPLTHAIAALLAAVLAAGVTIAVEPGPHHRVVIHIGKTATVSAVPNVIAVDNADANATPDNTVTVTPKARDVAQTLATGAAAGTNDLKPREKPNLPPLSGPITGPVAQLQPPFASDSVPGCRTRFFTTNWSARAAGATPRAFWLHYTAGPDVPNSRSDVDGLTAFGNNPSSAVSWHFNMDKDGNCDYNVPLRYKAWTEAGGNSTGISIEVAGKGDAPYLRPGGYRELARIYLEIKRRYNIPLRVGALSNCSVTRTGIVTHWMGGPCSGGHVDIKPFDLYQVVRILSQYVAQAECSKRCHRERDLRARHKITHARLRKNHCTPKRHGYCDRLRSRNAAIHKAARREHISLKGTY